MATAGRIRFVSTTCPSQGWVPVSEDQLSRNRGDGKVGPASVVEALLQIPELSDPVERGALVAELGDLLRRPLTVSRSADARRDLDSLVKACAACSGGLVILARLLTATYPGEPATRAASLTQILVGPLLLSVPDRDSLRALLTDVPIEQIADAVAELVDAEALESLRIWRDLPVAIRALERLPVEDDGTPQILTFVDRLAHIVTGARSDDMRRWADLVAGGLGVDPTVMARLRAVSERGSRADEVPSPRASTEALIDVPVPSSRRGDDTNLIWGGVPIRNRNFTGRTELLDRLNRALQTGSKASVLPQTLQGMGGVGKTQLVIEYVHRHLDEYELVWWIPAEETASVLSSLSLLAERLGMPVLEDRSLTARTVLDALAVGDVRWLLVYDNADEPDALEHLVPSKGGHVILTTRNQEWGAKGERIEVDVFDRKESIELLQKRSRDERGASPITRSEADELAKKLGDLPLALEQAAAWCVATAMPVTEYIELLDSHMKDLLSEGKPAGYPASVTAFVTLAVERLRDTSPATAQLFEMFAFLGGEPVAVSLLRFGQNADVTPELRTVLAASILTNRTVRDLGRYGLAKLDPTQRLQVHRLVQGVLKATLSPELARRTLANVQNLLAKANPGDPDEQGLEQGLELHRQRDLGPHLRPADLVHAENLDARQAVLDHARYLYTAGDYESSRRIAREAADEWERDTSNPRVGAEGELTLVARAQVANAMRMLGFSDEAGDLVRDTYRRFRANPLLGERFELTLVTGNQVGHDLRIRGRYREALEFDRESVRLHYEVFGPGEAYTLRAQANLAVDHRMIGDFEEAYRLDGEIAGHWENVGGSDPRALAAYVNMARSLYGMGGYRAGLDVLERWWGPLQRAFDPGNSQMLLAGRTYAILLRKAGELAAAIRMIEDHQTRVRLRFGPNHEFTVAATVSYANALRQAGRLDEALNQIDDALPRYIEHFPENHPLTLVALVNKAMILRTAGEFAAARDLDARCFHDLGEVLAPDHPYTVCAGTALATDYSLAGDHDEALDLSTRMLQISNQTSGGRHEVRGGAEHPYLLMRAVNLSHDLRATGAADEADALLRQSLEGLYRALDRNHPEVTAIEDGRRTEGDIEAPPT
jgi:tetratricopeptide (TPR) repeat protein